METLFIPSEGDFKRWIKEAVKECLQESIVNFQSPKENSEPFPNRKEIAKYLRISLVTLTAWMKQGLPSHKQRGKVYFIKEEIDNHIKGAPGPWLKTSILNCK